MSGDNTDTNIKQFRNGGWDNRGVSVDAIVVNEHGELLLIRRGVEPFKGSWALPGGYVDWDETVEEAVARELKEETTLDAVSMVLIGVFSKPSRHPNQVINVAFLVEAKGDASAGDDAVDLRYLPLSDLPKLAFDHAEIISDYLKRND